MYQQRGGGNRGNRGGRFESRGNRQQDDGTNQRVCHIYDHSARGTLTRNNSNETLVGVIWDNNPKFLHPCMREELIFVRDLEKRREQRRARRDDSNMRNRREDEDSFVASA